MSDELANGFDKAIKTNYFKTFPVKKQYFYRLSAGKYVRPRNNILINQHHQTTIS
jgi:hypothetical protein